MSTHDAGRAEVMRENSALKRAAHRLEDERIRKFIEKNPDMTRAAIARQFGCSETRLRNALARTQR